MQRGLAITLILFVAVTLRPAEIEVAEALPIAAAPHEPIIGVASGDAEDPGAMTPNGDGRFTIDDRIYAGKSLVRSVSDDAARCLRQPSSVEDSVLESPRMTALTGAPSRSAPTSGRSTSSFGPEEFPSASGSWEVSRWTGDAPISRARGRTRRRIRPRAKARRSA